MGYSQQFNPLAYKEIQNILETITPFPSGKEFVFHYTSSIQAQKAKSLLYDWRFHQRQGDTFPFKISSLNYSPGFRVSFSPSKDSFLAEEREVLPKKSDLQKLNAITRNLIGVKNPFRLLQSLFDERRITLRESIYVLQQLIKATGEDSPFTPSKEHIQRAVLEAGKGMGLDVDSNTSNVQKSNNSRTFERKEEKDDKVDQNTL